MLREPTLPHMRPDSGLTGGHGREQRYHPCRPRVFLRALLSHPDVAVGRLDTGLAERTRVQAAAPQAGDIGQASVVVTAVDPDRSRGLAGGDRELAGQ